MNEKAMYQRPTIEVIEVEYEGVMAGSVGSSDMGSDGTSMPSMDNTGYDGDVFWFSRPAAVVLNPLTLESR